jgi:hypothetical protein
MKLLIILLRALAFLALLVLLAIISEPERRIISSHCEFLSPGDVFVNQSIAVGETRVFFLASLAPDTSYEARVSTIGATSSGVKLKLTIEHEIQHHLQLSLAASQKRQQQRQRSIGRRLLDTERQKLVLHPGTLFSLFFLDVREGGGQLVLQVTADWLSPAAAVSAASSPAIVSFTLQLERFYFGLVPESAAPVVCVVLSTLWAVLWLFVPAALRFC